MRTSRTSSIEVTHRVNGRRSRGHVTFDACDRIPQWTALSLCACKERILRSADHVETIARSAPVTFATSIRSEKSRGPPFDSPSSRTCSGPIKRCSHKQIASIMLGSKDKPASSSRAVATVRCKATSMPAIAPKLVKVHTLYTY